MKIYVHRARDTLSSMDAQRANEAVSHRELLQAVWGPDYGDQVDYLRVFIKNLRKKIETNPEQPEYIKTEPWVGYRFNGSIESS